jgi:hypothetical protein
VRIVKLNTCVSPFGLILLYEVGVDRVKCQFFFAWLRLPGNQPVVYKNLKQCVYE